MGVSPCILSLYNQLKVQGGFDTLAKVVEMGSQDLKWWGQEKAMARFCKLFPGNTLSSKKLSELADAGPSRDFFEGLGIDYNCIDMDGRYGALKWDMNFDQVPDEHRKTYDLVTNYGTSEHVCNQANVFKMMHDLAKPDGLIIHYVPAFGIGIIDHGFFHYQPNFFDALAKHNGYEILGLWLSLDVPGHRFDSLIPWSEHLLEAITIAPGSHTNVCALYRKVADEPFNIPFQGIYSDYRLDGFSGNYNYVVDGQILNRDREKFYSKLSDLSGYILLKELIFDRVPKKAIQILKKLFKR